MGSMAAMFQRKCLNRGKAIGSGAAVMDKSPCSPLSNNLNFNEGKYFTGVFRSLWKSFNKTPKFDYIFGAVAQLGERSVRNAEVEGSTPFGSTKSRKYWSCWMGR